MAEQLGEALLVLRTDDRGLTSGIADAKGKSDGLGKALEQTSGSAMEMSKRLTESAQAGNRAAAAYLATDAAIKKLAAAQADAGAEMQTAKAQFKASEISATQYNASILQTRTALSLVEAEYAKASTALRAATLATEAGVASHGRMSTSSMMLMHSVRSMSDGMAAGLPITMLLTEQIGRLGEVAALSGAEGGALGKLGALMGGPWGIVIIVAITLLGRLISAMNLFETAAEHDAKVLKDVQLATDNLSDIQSTLGQVFDLTTGKVTEQAAALQDLARAQLLVNKATAEGNLALANRQLSDLQKPEWKFGGGFGGGIDLHREAGPQAAVIAQFMVNPQRPGAGKDAQYRLRDLQQQGKITLETYITSIRAIAAAEIEPLNSARADKGLTSLDTGHLAPEFMRAGHKGRTKHGPTADELQARQDALVDQLQEQELQARLQMATTVEERADIQRELLGKEKDRAIAQVNADTKATDAQRQARMAEIEKLYGSSSIGPNGETIAVSGLKQQALSLKEGQDITDRDLGLKREALQSQNQQLAAQAELARTTKERLAIALRTLENDRLIDLATNDQALADHRITSAVHDQRASKINQLYDTREQGARLQNASPMDAYLRSIGPTQAERGEKVQSLIVSELDYVNQAIDSAITSRLGIKDPLLAGLVDMFVKDLLYQIMGGLKGGLGGGGGGGGLFGGLFSSVVGGLFGGFHANGGTIPTGTFGIVGENGPEPIFSAPGGGIGVMPNSTLRGTGRGGGNTYNISGNLLTAEFWAQIQQMDSAAVGQGLAAYDPHVLSRVQDQSARFG